MDPGSLKMPFGKHRGERLRDIDTAYLRWLLRECDGLEAWLSDAVEAELQSRRTSGSGRGQRRQPRDDQPAPMPAVLHPGVVAWRESWRRIIFLAHPDRGGDPELCAILTDLNDKMQPKVADAACA